jgi:putative hydrolase of the HAD superfamily
MPIRNLILDLGGVLFAIDYRRPVDAFRKLGFPEFQRQFSQQEQHHFFDDFEKGLITIPVFRDRLRSFTSLPVSDQAIDAAWNSILVGFPDDSRQLLERLQGKYRLFLLSNTNALHEIAFRKMIREQHGADLLDELFEKVYLSHRIHQRKPDRDAFDLVMNDAGLDPDETFFVDDSPQHVKGAELAGIHAAWLELPKSTTILLEELKLL